MRYPIIEIKKKIIETLSSHLENKGFPTTVNLENPPDEQFGDFAFPCFALCQKSKKSPQITSQEIADHIPKLKWIKKVSAQGGYINFFIDELLCFQFAGGNFFNHCIIRFRIMLFK